MKPFLTYAQLYEDWLLYNMFFNVEKGFYIDVGAYSPWLFSVTKYLYDIGWRGINIEPIKEKFDEFQTDRPNDINLNIAVGSKNGEVELFLADDATSCDPETVNDPKWFLYEERGTLPRQHVQMCRLADVLAEYVPADKPVHFCKIDVEGSEKSVLEGMDFSLHRPWIFVIESALPGTAISVHDRWEHILTEQGYQLIYTHSVNRYYLDSRNSEADALVRGNLAQLEERGRQTSLYRVVPAPPLVRYQAEQRDDVLTVDQVLSGFITNYYQKGKTIRGFFGNASRIAVYGLGAIGKAIAQDLMKSGDVELMLFDAKLSGDSFLGYPILSPGEIGGGIDAAVISLTLDYPEVNKLFENSTVYTVYDLLREADA